MLRQIAGAWLLITLSLGVAAAQNAPQKKMALRTIFIPTSIAVTYNAERAKTVSSGCNCFWIPGAGIDANWRIWNGVGIAAQVNGGHASNIAPDVGIKKVNFLFGPRYTWQPSRRKRGYRPSIFGEFLAGGVHAYGTVIPTSTGTTSSATSFGFQTGGGANLWLTRHFGLRVIELDYVYSEIPNAGDSTQNDFRIATGVVWRLP